MSRRHHDGLFAKVEAGFSGRMPRIVRRQASAQSSKADENQYFIYSVSRSAAPIVGANAGVGYVAALSRLCETMLCWHHYYYYDLRANFSTLDVQFRATCPVFYIC